ncbi:putative amino acid/polyamine transporter I [Helianthus annuus]|uniref:Amino acid/polyamine transporter I n=1 Tax=Helianthus annuus TaxID=4232 RepID=A0A9K3DJG8_HELAN|nr:putative amino acid/polyamine transporter I [Helianthus annuus]KAJ0428976.1 putative amino acid/polyamine transporter I [Helianthus annuus]KAJ0812957.1 putative amino acid/polyamine transporter I [Helianthus annuus]
MAMARDGLLPSFFSEVNMHTQVPVKSTILTSLVAATLSFCMDVEQLARMVSVGTLLAFTMVAISVLILRYVTSDEVPLPSSLQAVIDSVSLRYSNVIRTNKTDVEVSYGRTGVSGEKNSLLPKNR